MTEEYGKGFTKSNLYSFYNFYKAYANIFQMVSGKFNGSLLSWSHYQLLTLVNDLEARNCYENEAINETWSFRTLQRNIFSQYYYHLLKFQQKELAINEMENLTRSYQYDKLEFIKNPMIAEFLGVATDVTFAETDLETSILSNIQKFLIELGKGYTFIARQQHFHTEK